MEQSRDHEDRLASNKLALENSVVNVQAGQVVQAPQRKIPTWSCLLCGQDLAYSQELPGNWWNQCHWFL